MILHLNDFHGQVYPVKRSSGELGGIRALSAMVEAERGRVGAEQMLLLDAGDWFQGTPEGNLTDGRMIIDLFNEIGVDASAIGNHDFDLGVPILGSLIERADFPILGANILKPDRSGPVEWALRTTIIERGGIRFGLVGVVTEDTKNIVIANVAASLQFANTEETVRAAVDNLKLSGAECIIVLSHLGDHGDDELARTVAGIDLIIGGHSHSAIPPKKDPTHGTVIAQAESNGMLLGRIEVRRAERGFEIGGDLLPVVAREEPVSPAIEAILAEYRPEIEGVMGEVVGKSPMELARPIRISDDGGRKGWHPESDPLTTWIARVMANAAGTEIAIHNRGGVRAALPEGTVTRRDLFGISPFGNTIVRATLTGAQLKEMVRVGLSTPNRRFDVVGLEIGWTHGAEYGVVKELAYLKAGGVAVADGELYSIATNNYLGGGGDSWTQFESANVKDTGLEVYEATVEAFRAGALEVEEDFTKRFKAIAAETHYLQRGTVTERGTSLFGLFVLLGIAWLLSTNRKALALRTVIWGVALQAIMAGLILRTGPGRALFNGAKKAFDLVLSFSAEGAAFVWGPLSDVPASGFIFAVQISATIILVSAVTAILYHIGVMQVIVYLLAKVMQWTMRTSGAESLSAAANIFVGQTEAPLVVRPYLARMTASETMCLMTGGMATVAGGVLAAYVGFGIDAGHLLAASVMSAPAALAIAKIMVPETEQSATAANVPFDIQKIDSNVLDAACRGASDGLKLALNVMAMLIAFTALVAMVNWGIGEVHEWFFTKDEIANPDFHRLSLGVILGWVFAPIAWLLGVPREEMFQVGSLLGIKMTLNEFMGYLELASIKDTMSPRSTMLATYALCGFANFASIAIQIGGISALESGLRPTLAKYGFRAMLGGTLAALTTACVAGVLT